MLPLYFVFSLLLFFIHIAAQPVNNDPSLLELYRFPNGTQIENILVLRNGSLLLTLLTEPSLYLLNPKSSNAPVLVQRFYHQTSLLGITQLNQSTVAVIAGNLTGSTYESNAGVPGSFFIFLLALLGRIVASFPIPEASLLESITALPDSPYNLLMSDPTLAVIWRLNTLTGAIDKLIADPIFAKNPEDQGPSLNGIHVLGPYLYFTNTHQGLLGRIRIARDGTPVGSGGSPQFETRSYSFIYYRYDDFALRPDGSLFITDPIGNTVTRVGPQDAPYELSVVVNGGIVEHPTAVAFASNSDSVQRNIMYVVTAGFLPGYGGTGGGQVLRVDLGLVGEGLGGAGFVGS